MKKIGIFFGKTRTNWGTAIIETLLTGDTLYSLMQRSDEDRYFFSKLQKESGKLFLPILIIQISINTRFQYEINLFF